MSQSRQEARAEARREIQRAREADADRSRKAVQVGQTTGGWREGVCDDCGAVTEISPWAWRLAKQFSLMLLARKEKPFDKCPSRCDACALKHQLALQEATDREYWQAKARLALVKKNKHDANDVQWLLDHGFARAVTAILAKRDKPSGKKTGEEP